MPPVVVALHASTKSRAPLARLLRATAIENQGIEGDRHSRPDNRRAVLLVEQEVLEGFGLAPGDVREQLTVCGLDLKGLAFGSRLAIGEAVLEIAGPCAPCARMDELQAGLREGLEGRRGRFARVVKGGALAVGDPILVSPPA